jgi:putative ABC transport system permease protein
MRLDVGWLGDWSRLISYAVRSLRRSPGFTAAAVLTLAVGIGATSAICSVVNTILLQPLPLRDADRLVRIVERERPRNLPSVNYREYLDWQSRTTSLAGLAATTLYPQVVMPAPTGLVRVTGGLVSSNYFEVLGARALLGRALVAADADHPDVMVLGYYTWKRHFASDPQVIGSVVHFRSGSLAGRSLTVIGVMPDSMETVAAPIDFYTPIAAVPNAGTLALAQLIGRIHDGTALVAAADEANVVGAAVRPPRPASAPPLTGPRFDVRRLKDDMFDPPFGRQGGGPTVRTVLQIFLGAVTVVLLIVCANVANLLLARGTARRREFATRLALGASRWQLARQILAECVVLAAAGGAIGAGLGAAGVSAIKWLATVDAQGVFRIVFGDNLLPRANEVGIDLRLFGITLAVAVITTFAFALLPALHLSRSEQLQTIGSRGGGTKKDTRVRTLLVVGQLAMATVLLVAAALLSASFVNLAGVEKGYDPANVLAFQLVLPDEYPTARKAESIEAVLRAIRAVPGVSRAGFAYAGILIGVQDTVGSFVTSGSAPETTGPLERPRLKSLGAGYLESTGATLLDGRLLGEGDSAQAAPVIVINKSAQRRYFGNVNPVGAFMDWHSGRGPHIPVQVVGVIADVRQGALYREPYPEVFMDYRQVIAIQQRWGLPAGAVDHLAFGFMSFAMRTLGNPADLIPQVRQAIARADPNAALDAIMPMDSLVADSVARQRFYAVMLAAFAAVAALLGAIGVYGVLAYFVVDRTREIGLRMALGAGRRQVVGLVLGRGLVCAAIGIALGLAGAAAGTRYLQSMLYGIAPLDGRMFAVVALAFAMVAALASYLPARRATCLDPMAALRLE